MPWRDPCLTGPRVWQLPWFPQLHLLDRSPASAHRIGSHAATQFHCTFWPQPGPSQRPALTPISHVTVTVTKMIPVMMNHNSILPRYLLMVVELAIIHLDAHVHVIRLSCLHPPSATTSRTTTTGAHATRHGVMCDHGMLRRLLCLGPMTQWDPTLQGSLLRWVPISLRLHGRHSHATKSRTWYKLPWPSTSRPKRPPPRLAALAVCRSHSILSVPPRDYRLRASASIASPSIRSCRDEPLLARFVRHVPPRSPGTSSPIRSGNLVLIPSANSAVLKQPLLPSSGTKHASRASKCPGSNKGIASFKH